MTLHNTTFEYLKPTDGQIETMAMVRELFSKFAMHLGDKLPDGPDKTYVMRQLRDCAMWSNVAITRQPDGAPRT